MPPEIWSEDELNNVQVRRRLLTVGWVGCLCGNFSSRGVFLLMSLVMIDMWSLS